MQKTCTNDWCQTSFEVTDDDVEFLKRVSPVFNDVTYELPAPTRCPDCRQQRRIALVNEQHLTMDECALCKKKTLNQYTPGNGKPIHCRECWHSDNWDPCDYDIEPDFTRPVFDQIREVKMKVPDQGVSVQGTMINSDYTHCVGSLKNCNLIMHADFCEDCLYGYGYKKNTSCMDGFYVLHSELCYDCVDVHKSYGLIACQECHNCRTSAFLRDCIGCQDCFMCTGLREKQYCFRNEQLTKDEYEEKMKKIDLQCHSQYQQYMQERLELEKSHSFREFQGYNLENCTGNHLINCKNAQSCYDIEDGENLKYCYQLVLGARNCRDVNQYGSNLQESYECCIVGENSYHLLFTVEGHISSKNLLYCMYMERCSDCFGCSGMHDKQYCIFNKQYTKDEYEELVPKIIEYMKTTGEWGEMIDPSHACFGYNKTTAQLYFPLTKEECSKRGWHWDDFEPPPPKTTKVIDASQLPDCSTDVPDDVLNWAIKCEKTGKLFKLQTLELRLYRQLKLPIPRRCPEQRHIDRFSLRNPRTLWTRTCDSCNTSMQTTWSPEKPHRILCEKCYNSEVY